MRQIRLLVLLSLLIVITFGTVILLRSKLSPQNVEVNATDIQVQTNSFENSSCTQIETGSDEFAGQKIFSVCEVLSNPEFFNGKTITLKATIGWFIHGFPLYNDECRTGTIAADISSEKVGQPISNLFQKGSYADIVAVGKFSMVEPSGNSDSMWDNAKEHFEIICLKEIKANERTK